MTRASFFTTSEIWMVALLSLSEARCQILRIMSTVQEIHHFFVEFEPHRELLSANRIFSCEQHQFSWTKNEKKLTWIERKLSYNQTLLVHHCSKHTKRIRKLRARWRRRKKVSAALIIFRLMFSFLSLMSLSLTLFGLEQSWECVRHFLSSSQLAFTYGLS